MIGCQYSDAASKEGLFLFFSLFSGNLGPSRLRFFQSRETKKIGDSNAR